MEVMMRDIILRDGLGDKLRLLPVRKEISRYDKTIHKLLKHIIPAICSECFSSGETVEVKDTEQQDVDGSASDRYNEIVESFQSMTELLDMYMPDNIDIILEVNRYIDEKIDEGAVSSFYAFTHTPGRTSCIKRYLRAGSNSLI